MKKLTLFLKILIASLLISGCYSWYENKVEMDTDTPKINLGDLLYNEVEVTSLEPPEQIIVSQGKYSGTIKIHWSEVPYATSYRLERAIVKEPDSDTGKYNLPDEGDFEVINNYVYSTNFSDVILVSPLYNDEEYSYRYYYRVSAENIKNGLESSEFTEVSDDSCGWLLPPPASIDAAKGENSEYIEVSWKPVPQANRYCIYRGQNDQGHGMEYIASVSGNKLSFQDPLSQNEKGLEFYYKVCAVLQDGSESAFTGLALGYSAKEGAPVAPDNIIITNGNGVSKDSLNIKWDSVTKTGYDIKYNVYRTSSTDSVYKLVRSNITSENITDSSPLKTGIKYYYYVQTVAVSKTDTTDILKSPFSKTGPLLVVNGTETQNPKAAVGWLLSPPNNCEVVDSSIPEKYLLRWTPAVGSETVNYCYNIYYSNTLNGDYILLHHLLQPDTPDLSTASDGYYSFAVDKKSFYRVTTVNSTTMEECDIKASIEVAPCPAAPQSVTATKTASLGGITNYTPNTNGVYPVQITWSAPAGEAPYGYYVYRSTKPDSSFRKITDSPITDNSFVFIDTNETARPGTFYYYKVVSLNILMQGKNSNTQNADTRGYGALTRDQWFREYNKTVKKSLSKLTLMHKSGDTDKLGSETINGEISGSLSYNAKLDGFSGRVLMHYTNYADFNIKPDESLGVYFLLNGDTNTSASASKNGSMDGTNVASTMGMYPGYAKYDNIAIKGGAAGGGYYVVCTQDKNGNTVLGEGNVDWTVGEE